MKYIAILVAALAVATGVSAQQLSLDAVSPGTLESRVGSNVSATSLSVSGSLDVRDLDFISSKMTSLTTLDLGNASIAAFEGDRPMFSLSTCRAGELPRMSLAGLKATTVVLPSSLTSVGDGALAGSALTSLTIPAGVKNIGAGAFASCTGLTKVTIPATVATVGAAVFEGCDKLASVSFLAPEVPQRAFAGCAALKNVTLGNGVTAIGDGAFAGCTGVTGLTFTPTALRTIGARAFAGSGIESLDLTECPLRTIGDWAFAGSALKSLAMPAWVPAIGRGAFFDASSLTSLSGGRGATEVADATYKGLTAYEGALNPGDDIVEIGRYAFAGASMSEFHLSGSLDYIGDRAFSGCTAVKPFDGPTIAVVPELGTEVWKGVDQPEVILSVPGDLIESFAAADQWKEFRIVNSGLDDIAADTDAGNRLLLKGHFEGSALIVGANVPLAEVRVFDITGRRLAEANAGGALNVALTVDVPRGNIILVSATAEGGLSGALKIFR